MDWTFIPDSQICFRKGLSTTDNLAALTLEIERAFDKKDDVLCAFLDVKGAFNYVQPDILLKILADFGCSQKLIELIKFLTYERFIYTEYNLNKARLVNRGVPQGGVFSPLLYILYTHKIEKNINSRVSLLQYADDIAVYIKTDNYAEDINLLQNSIMTINRNLDELVLELSVEKTVFMHFSKNKIKPTETALIINNNEIQSAHSAKF